VAGPLGADYHISAPPEADDRVSLLIQSTPPRTRRDASSVMDRVFFNPEVRPQTTHAIAWRRGDLGGSNGHGNARSVAMVQSVLACGGEARGVRLMARIVVETTLEVREGKIVRQVDVVAREARVGRESESGTGEAKGEGR
jgi:hypothetical protein